ncbi:hypothetical protein REC12_25835 [Desulfosporosinus sp. PR]|uniref:WD40/YVTN/BNR-like repeat-containing protein n=1 Tax=Candidatus Desulfosporosinus nitrosoreducens TaxID=3401928 RepID=UPI0027EB174B|nr:hypothetical protein [Desulfosporosinus sp. PR]MDQ7097020.1 hypothetical protein [Desulfosporosinus sp. PR]
MKRASGLAFFSLIIISAVIVVLMVAESSYPIRPTSTQPDTKPVSIQVPAQNLKDVNEIKYVKMVNETLGFEIYAKGLRRTTDGGKTWGSLTYPELTFGEFFNGLVIDFSSPKAGWIAVGSSDEPSTIVLHTDDGGDNWVITRLSNITGIISLDFIDDEHGWLLANTQGGAMGSFEVELYATTDGGNHWSEIMDAKADLQTPGSLPFAGHKSGMNFQDSQNGWSTGGIGSSDDLWLYETNDGGHTWKTQDIPYPPTIAKLYAYPYTSPPKFFSSNEGIFKATFHGEEDNSGKVAFYSTTDSGKSWTPSRPITVIGPFVSDFVSLEEGWVIDKNGIRSTIDGGKHWTKITPNVEFTGIEDLNLISSTVGFVTTFIPARDKSSQDIWKLYKTKDGGHSWLEISLIP